MSIRVRDILAVYMAEEAMRFSSDNRNKYSGEPESVAVMIFGFLEESEESSDSSSNSTDSYGSEDLFAEEEEEEGNSCNAEESKAFWESQEELLQATLCRTSTIESKVRQTTKDLVRELQTVGINCVCRRPVTKGCRDCMQREISNRLQKAGYDCAICKSKWMSSNDIPSGEHTYMEVVDNSSSKKGEIRIVIELNFRGEFEMARAGEEYNRLANKLPVVFVGKIERLRALIKILCAASKRCMKERKMHMAPWRKQKYMQAKWHGKRERSAPPPVLPVVERLDQPSRRRSSMLTFDLLENSPLHCMAIEVV
ncbi:hypothetical protein RJ639_023951 [Escallonia herrerae]|uniref:Uncharacterized protein n=1 Tax=Escallonia herrerae TaxID=1293975 RepID=A0AA88UZ06_9ASTE|nr:hypothetical protein RJ639_023951 [Escallonia herrerae]